MLPLAMVGEKIRARVVNIAGGDNAKQRLFAMGIHPNAILQVEINRNTGPLIISVGKIRIGIGRGMANKVMVEQI
ncbi:FeoA family protein [Hippea maritima]|uniref:FeoA family protein n=1 Tax=Hippea maritima (strain ATCC 700847 / DSM 10411 / MH2) TaxID=760142 RepID=F2LVP2_HIPMA|nr:FeoA domain-containing protein [Hippea maritima]AEA33826.1 FeoA family protein [Hippea maritima DSM 10411]